MVFNREVLFIHLGKTGGMSTTFYLCSVLKPPVISVLGEDHLKRSKQMGHEIFLPFKRHANLMEASDFLAQYGMALQDFKLIFAVIRNPVGMECSYYKHLRKPVIIDRLSAKPENMDRLRAAQGSFDDFAKSSFTHFRGALRDFFTLNGKTPANMKFARFESLALEVTDLVAPYTMQSMEFPHRNKSREIIESTKLSREALDNIRKKYDFFYEMGFYE